MLEELLPLNGQCTCGATKYQILSKPLFVHCCHCTWCQRETGASFALNAFIESKYVKLIQGKPKTVITPTNSKDGQKIVRCPSCKIALWGHYTGAGDIISFVRVGTLDDPNVLKPDIHIYTSAKQDWLQLSNDVPQVDEYYQKVDYWPIESIERFNQVKGN
jgi:hypothetical protein